jgi:acyl-CoA thioesterase-1
MGISGLAGQEGRNGARRGAFGYVARPGFFNARACFKALGRFAFPALVAFLVGGAPAAWAKDAPRILMLGDSITAGYGLPEAESLPVRLQAVLRKAGHPAKVINGGVSGDTTAGGLARLDWLLGEKPDMVIVELGGNDGLRGLDPKDTRANLDRILSRLEAAKIKVLLTGMYAPPNLGREYGTEFDGIFPALAKKYGCAFYPFVLDGVATKPGLNQADGIHPNAQGVTVIVQRLLPYVVKVLDG